MFHGGTVPRHVDSLDGAKRLKGSPDGLLSKLKIDTPHIDPMQSPHNEREIQRNRKNRNSSCRKGLEIN